MILNETPRRQRVTKLVSWGHWFTFFNIIIAIVIASIYVFNSRLPETGLGAFYLLVNWIGHVSYLTFIGFIILVLPLCYLVPNVKVAKGAASAIAAVGIAFLAFDALLYNKYGLHINFGTAELLRYESHNLIGHFGWQQWGFLALLFVVWLMFQLVMANALWKRIERFKLKKFGQPVAIFFTVCFIASHATHIWADANLYQPIIKQDDMFPLSYPATAKTLMSKYGLLDIDNYMQRKELQLDRRIAKAKYPASALYCSINNALSIQVAIVTGENSSKVIQQLAQQYELAPLKNHYDLSSNAENGFFSLLFGLPELYKNALEGQAPVLMDLPQKLGLTTQIYAPETGYSNIDWPHLLEQSTTTPALTIAVVSPVQAKQLLQRQGIPQSQLILTEFSANKLTTTYSNIKNIDSSVISSHQDIAPTLLNLLGCNTTTNSYSTGQNLLKPSRNWLVSTLGDKVLLLNQQHRIEIDGSGNYKIFDRVNNEQLSEELDTSLLSQAMKHLSRFVQE
ncbi:DUF3413 domain-containing protein [Alteromonadaceae bacterium BrNp21-10]|nr:DUF3413 domain-containing protein [Alteromonadaceae bacterium BrNp21-10]